VVRDSRLDNIFFAKQVDIASICPFNTCRYLLVFYLHCGCFCVVALPLVEFMVWQLHAIM